MKNQMSPLKCEKKENFQDLSSGMELTNKVCVSASVVIVSGATGPREVGEKP